MNKWQIKTIYTMKWWVNIKKCQLSPNLWTPCWNSNNFVYLYMCMWNLTCWIENFKERHEVKNGSKLSRENIQESRMTLSDINNCYKDTVHDIMVLAQRILLTEQNSETRKRSHKHENLI